MKLTIIGGGNIGTLMAAEAAYKGHDVTVYTSRPKEWEKEISVYDIEDRMLLTGTIAKVTDCMKIAVQEAEYVLVTMPPHLFGGLEKEMVGYLQRGQKLGVFPGGGGAEFAFHEIIKKGVTLFGLQRVHSIARLKKYGKEVYQLGRKSSLKIGAIPSTEAEAVCSVFEQIFDMPCEALDNYLAVTLTPSNPILHTTRLYSMFKDYKEGDVYPRNFLFYEEWTDEASKILIACDAELQELCKTLPLDLSAVVSLRDYYESQTVEAMTGKIRGIKAFKGLSSPMREVEGGWIPDWESRYFIADFAFGLKIIKDLGRIFKVSMPEISKVWEWYERKMLYETEVFSINLKRDMILSLYGTADKKVNKK